MAAYNPTVDERVLFSAERGLRIRVPSAKRGDQQLKSAAFVVTNIALYAVSTAPGTKYKWLCRIAWLDLQAVLLSHGKSEEAVFLPHADARDACALGLQLSSSSAAMRLESLLRDSCRVILGAPLPTAGLSDSDSRQSLTTLSKRFREGGDAADRIPATSRPTRIRAAVEHASRMTSLLTARLLGSLVMRTVSPDAAAASASSSSASASTQHDSVGNVTMSAADTALQVVLASTSPGPGPVTLNAPPSTRQKAAGQRRAAAAATAPPQQSHDVSRATESEHTASCGEEAADESAGSEATDRADAAAAAEAAAAALQLVKAMGGPAVAAASAKWVDVTHTGRVSYMHTVLGVAEAVCDQTECGTELLQRLQHHQHAAAHIDKLLPALERLLQQDRDADGQSWVLRSWLSLISLSRQHARLEVEPPALLPHQQEQGPDSSLPLPLYSALVEAAVGSIKVPSQTVPDAALPSSLSSWPAVEVQQTFGQPLRQPRALLLLSRAVADASLDTKLRGAKDVNALFVLSSGGENQSRMMEIRWDVCVALLLAGVPTAAAARTPQHKELYAYTLSMAAMMLYHAFKKVNVAGGSVQQQVARLGGTLRAAFSPTQDRDARYMPPAVVAVLRDVLKGVCTLASKHAGSWCGSGSDARWESLVGLSLAVQQLSLHTPPAPQPAAEGQDDTAACFTLSCADFHSSEEAIPLSTHDAGIHSDAEADVALLERLLALLRAVEPTAAQARAKGKAFTAIRAVLQHHIQQTQELIDLLKSVAGAAADVVAAAVRGMVASRARNAGPGLLLPASGASRTGLLQALDFDRIIAKAGKALHIMAAPPASAAGTATSSSHHSHASHALHSHRHHAHTARAVAVKATAVVVQAAPAVPSSVSNGAAPTITGAVTAAATTASPGSAVLSQPALEAEPVVVVVCCTQQQPKAEDVTAEVLSAIINDDHIPAPADRGGESEEEAEGGGAAAEADGGAAEAEPDNTSENIEQEEEPAICSLCNTAIANASDAVAAPGAQPQQQQQLVHALCVRCSACDVGLHGGEYYMRAGKLYCKTDLLRKYTDSLCSECCSVLQPGEKAVRAAGRLYHSDHYACSSCSTHLTLADAVMETDDGPVCSKCSNSAAHGTQPGSDACYECGGLLSQPAPAVAAAAAAAARRNSGSGAGAAAASVPPPAGVVEAGGHHMHAACFHCITCKRIFRPGAVYFTHLNAGGRLVAYCKADYEAAFAPHCNACGLVVRGADVLLACGGAYHRACFACTDCECALAPAPEQKPSARGGSGGGGATAAAEEEPPYFFSVDAHPYCNSCYYYRFGKLCQRCGEYIEGQAMVSGEVSWHPGCFVCFHCDAAFDSSGGRFYSDEAKHCYCEDCFCELYCPICPACQCYVLHERVEVRGRDTEGDTPAAAVTYHPGCAVCDDCNEPLMDMAYPSDGDASVLLCRQHYLSRHGKSCAACDGWLLAGQSLVQALGKEWHTTCLHCTVCNKGNATADELYLHSDGKPYCDSHYAAVAGPVCAGCSGRIMPGTQLLLAQQPWHAACLVCSGCHTNLQGAEKVARKEGKLLCHRCTGTAAATGSSGSGGAGGGRRSSVGSAAAATASSAASDHSGDACPTCGHSIVGKYVSVLRRRYHAAGSERGGATGCLVCRVCGPGHSFTQPNGDKAKMLQRDDWPVCVSHAKCKLTAEQQSRLQ